MCQIERQASGNVQLGYLTPGKPSRLIKQKPALKAGIFI